MSDDFPRPDMPRGQFSAYAYALVNGVKTAGIPFTCEAVSDGRHSYRDATSPEGGIRTEVSDENGLVHFTGLLFGWVYAFRRQEGERVLVTISYGANAINGLIGGTPE